MSTLSAYLQTWKLKLSHTKTVTAVFQLNNRETKCELKDYNNDRLLLFYPMPTYSARQKGWLTLQFFSFLAIFLCKLHQTLNSFKENIKQHLFFDRHMPNFEKIVYLLYNY